MDRFCTVCGRKMKQGYVVGDGLEYFCGDNCLKQIYSADEYKKMYINDQAYWTEWEEE